MGKISIKYKMNGEDYEYTPEFYEEAIIDVFSWEFHIDREQAKKILNMLNWHYNNIYEKLYNEHYKFEVERYYEDDAIREYTKNNK